MKNYEIQFNSDEWSLYDFDTETEITNRYLKKILNIDVSEEAYYLNDTVDIVINYNSVEDTGLIDLELDGYVDRTKIKSYDDFVEKMKNLDGIVGNFKANVAEWKYEEEFPYASRGLSVSDFI